MSEDLTIETTDLYVRFLPVDSLELNTLDADTTLNLYDYPLDFEIEQVDHWYHDPSIPDHLPTYQYTVVKPDYQFSHTIEHEVLAELFIPEELEDDIEEGRVSIDYDFLDALEDEALRMTGNWEEKVDNPNARCRRKCWSPHGYIKVRERTDGISQGWVPVKEIQVRVRRWFTIKTDDTDANGYFQTAKFQRPVNYSIVFKTLRFRIAGWTGLTNRYNGPKRRGSWDVNFEWHNDWWTRATVMNAICDFKFQARRHGLAMAGTWDPTRVRVVFNSGTSNTVRQAFRHEIPLLVNNDVKLYTKFSNNSNLETDDLYVVTMHELGHVSHYIKSPFYAKVTFLTSAHINESFAVATEYEFTRHYYPNIVTDNPSTPLYYEGVIDRSRTEIENGGDDSWKYTCYFIDLMDNTNQFVTRGGSTNTDFANDRVSGYTLKQFQTAMDKRTTLHGIKQYLRDNYSNQAGLNELTDFYQDMRDDNKDR